jgi:hypothetical protein
MTIGQKSHTHERVRTVRLKNEEREVKRGNWTLQKTRDYETENKWRK